VKKKYLCLFLLITSGFSQDSLYLIGTFTGKSTEEKITTFSGIGDVNGDGYDDFMICYSQNYANLYLGDNIFDTIPDIKFICNNSDVGVIVLEKATDVNADGYDDILIKSIDFSLTGFFKGIVHLYLGGSVIDTIADFEYYEGWIQDAFGHSMSNAGDVNNDGYNDVIIGSPYNWSDGMGYAYLFYGGDTIVSKPVVIFKGFFSGDDFGNAVASIGDINNDQYDDIIIGAPAYVAEADTQAKAFIYFGGKNMDNNPDIVLDEDAPYFGFQIENAGNLCNDENIYYFIKTSGAAFLYKNLDLSTFFVPAEYIGTGGDINDDGYNDFLLSNGNYINNNGSMVGGVYGFYGSNPIDTTADFFMQGENQWGQFGLKVEIIGDINKDGFDEVMVYAPKYPDYQYYLGKIYLYSYKKINVIEGDAIPIKSRDLQILKIFPNPFNSNINISYKLLYHSNVTIEVFNTLGQSIKKLVSSTLPSGQYYLNWDGSDNCGNYVASGIYFIQISLEGKNLQKMIKTVFIK